MVVGKPKLVTTDGAGHRQAHRANRARSQAQTGQVNANGVFRALIVGGGQHLDRFQLPVLPQRKPRVGPSDVTDQR
ncbi:hypothetical protein D3C73_1538320 [compost metagenome]